MSRCGLEKSPVSSSLSQEAVEKFIYDATKTLLVLKQVLGGETYFFEDDRKMLECNSPFPNPWDSQTPRNEAQEDDLWLEAINARTITCSLPLEVIREAAETRFQNGKAIIHNVNIFKEQFADPKVLLTSQRLRKLLGKSVVTPAGHVYSVKDDGSIELCKSRDWVNRTLESLTMAYPPELVTYEGSKFFSYWDRVNRKLRYLFVPSEQVLREIFGLHQIPLEAVDPSSWNPHRSFFLMNFQTTSQDLWDMGGWPLHCNLDLRFDTCALEMHCSSCGATHKALAGKMNISLSRPIHSADIATLRVSYQIHCRIHRRGCVSLYCMKSYVRTLALSHGLPTLEFFHEETDAEIATMLGICL